MRAKVSRRLVIDASVVRSAGGEQATFPRSKRCRDFLKETLAVCHRAVVTKAINDEWKRHESRFAKGWRTAMIARKKLLFVRVDDDASLRAEVDDAASLERESEAMIKDIHLIEAARAADGIVISLDDAVRDLFAAASSEVDALRAIVWVNPASEEDGGSSWLAAGAASERARQLGTQR